MLAQKHCISCKGASSLSADDARVLLKQLTGWAISEDGKWLEKTIRFKNFAQALSFVNKAGEIAEQEQHHPDMALGWGYVHIKLQTHDVGGLHENDFIIASKIDKIQ